MFNSSLKQDALDIHKNAVERYNHSYEETQNACDTLYHVREHALGTIAAVEVLINSIANHPKEFDKQLGEIKQNVLKFHQTKEFAEKALKEAAKSGVSILSGVAAGGAVASAAPSVAMSIATTFGHATTGTAISALSGAPAQKAALAWLGRKTAGIATKGVVTGAGMKAGQAFLALAGPIGWGITGASTAVSLASLTSKNKKISKNAIEESKEIMKARETLRETTEQVNHLRTKTEILIEEIGNQNTAASDCKNTDYSLLAGDAQMLLGTLVNNTLSLAALLNKVIE